VPAGFSQFLSGHAAMLVEFDRLVRHRPLPWSTGIRSLGYPDPAILSDQRFLRRSRRAGAPARLSRPSLSHQMELRIRQFNDGAIIVFYFR
jgi:hypothetical protein